LNEKYYPLEISNLLSKTTKQKKLQITYTKKENPDKD